MGFVSRIRPDYQKLHPYRNSSQAWVAFGMSGLSALASLVQLLITTQDIAPTYYDISTFPKGEIRSALMRAADRLSRKEKLRSDKRR